ncbi:hypothetical protein ABTM54_19050, partial [Acinetobacter baumannii]
IEIDSEERTRLESYLQLEGDFLLISNMLKGHENFGVSSYDPQIAEESRERIFQGVLAINQNELAKKFEDRITGERKVIEGAQEGVIDRLYLFHPE